MLNGWYFSGPSLFHPTSIQWKCHPYSWAYSFHSYFMCPFASISYWYYLFIFLIFVSISHRTNFPLAYHFICSFSAARMTFFEYYLCRPALLRLMHTFVILATCLLAFSHNIYYFALCSPRASGTQHTITYYTISDSACEQRKCIPHYWQVAKQHAILCLFREIKNTYSTHVILRFVLM